MSTISAVAPQTNPILSSNLNAVRQTSAKDGDGDHGVEAATPSVSNVGTAIAPGQPGAIVNTTA